ncbi:MAG: hypothetical protein F4Z10_02845 [Synechococcus sp. SB0666_bin_14]|nr:hypothetical protein [Synechococcus sp. SB0666_bin_14]MYA90399.1 hypothetical protein [Synechococcus sp. SB0663_bin_10]MYG45906.1 hypothetical protein [Synechococcus sp. SB0675_bin_6]MYJ60417.1 hypothetical protein [Synechococcus sp. SB0672_bin_6]MYK90648.1 hypothetical protein [Synechococcus sp. SB0669_bin_8]
MSTQQIPITESGMDFGPFAQDECFHVEESKAYKAIQDGVKMAEFLLLRANDSTSNNNAAIWIVEAKSSSPRPDNPSGDFGRFIDEIKQKLVNALSLGLACVLGRHPQAETELPSAFKNISLSRVQVKFVVVIKGRSDDTLSPITDALKKALHPTIKTWAFDPASVIVLNEALAREYGLINTTS